MSSAWMISSTTKTCCPFLCRYALIILFMRLSNGIHCHCVAWLRDQLVQPWIISSDRLGNIRNFLEFGLSLTKLPMLGGCFDIGRETLLGLLEPMQYLNEQTKKQSLSAFLGTSDLLQKNETWNAPPSSTNKHHKGTNRSRSHGQAGGQHKQEHDQRHHKMFTQWRLQGTQWQLEGAVEHLSNIPSNIACGTLDVKSALYHSQPSLVIVQVAPDTSYVIDWLPHRQKGSESPKRVLRHLLNSMQYALAYDCSRLGMLEDSISDTRCRIVDIQAVSSASKGGKIGTHTLTTCIGDIIGMVKMGSMGITSSACCFDATELWQEPSEWQGYGRSPVPSELMVDAWRTVNALYTVIPELLVMLRDPTTKGKALAKKLMDWSAHRSKHISSKDVDNAKILQAQVMFQYNAANEPEPVSKNAENSEANLENTHDDQAMTIPNSVVITPSSSVPQEGMCNTATQLLVLPAPPHPAFIGFPPMLTYAHLLHSPVLRCALPSPYGSNPLQPFVVAPSMQDTIVGNCDNSSALDEYFSYCNEQHEQKQAGQKPVPPHLPPAPQVAHPIQKPLDMQSSNGNCGTMFRQQLCDLSPLIALMPKTLQTLVANKQLYAALQQQACEIQLDLGRRPCWTNLASDSAAEPTAFWLCENPALLVSKHHLLHITQSLTFGENNRASFAN